MQELKIYCDICKKEIPERHSRYNIDISPIESGFLSGLTKKKSIMCQDCRNAVKEIVDKRMK